jgi:hypothetical protein
MSSIPATAPAAHFPIYRRGGTLLTDGVANFTYLNGLLALSEARFDLTSREIKENKVVRIPKRDGNGRADGFMAELGQNGTW